jgi:hypothetical protein
LPNRVQTLRSSVPGNRPTGRQPGELYTNWADSQIGVINASNAAQDLVGVRFFSSAANYVIGDHVIQAGLLYRATQAAAAGAFNAAQWTQIGGSVTVSDTAPSNPQPGGLWYDSTAAQLYVYYNDGNSSQWVIAVNMLGAYLPIGGGNLLGPLTLAGNATANLQPVTLQQMTAAGYAPLASPTFTGTVTIPAGASISGYATTAALATYAPLASPTFTGFPVLPFSANWTGLTNGSTSAAGTIGEFVSNANSGSIPSNAIGNLTSFTLSPGDWEVWGIVSYTPSANNVTFYAASLSTTSGAYGTYTTQLTLGSAIMGSWSMPLFRQRFNLTANQGILVTGGAVFASGTCSYVATINARRMR